AMIGDVAVAGLRPADGRARLEGVARAARSRAGTVLGDVAVTGRAPALNAARLEPVSGARAARPGTCLVRVAHAGRRAADRPGVAGRMLAGVARAVALVPGARVAVAGARRSCRALGVRGARRARSGARVGRVAVARRRAAHGAGVAGRMLAGIARAVALIPAARVAVVGARGSCRALGVGGAARR